MTRGQDDLILDQSPARAAESERIHRAWLNGEDTAPGAYDGDMEQPKPPTAG